MLRSLLCGTATRAGRRVAVLGVISALLMLCPILAAPAAADSTGATGATGPYPIAPQDYATTALDIVPSGEPGSVPIPDGATSQAAMYDALTPLAGNVTDAQLPQFFKPETLGT